MLFRSNLKFCQLTNYEVVYVYFGIKALDSVHVNVHITTISYHQSNTNLPLQKMLRFWD